MDVLRGGLIIILHPRDSVRAYKSGKLIREDTEMWFKYKKITHDNLERITPLRDLVMQSNQIVIETTSKIPFNVQDTIVLYQTKYSITSMYYEDGYLENSSYNFVPITDDFRKKYLVLTTTEN